MDGPWLRSRPAPPRLVLDWPRWMELECWNFELLPLWVLVAPWGFMSRTSFMPSKLRNHYCHSSKVSSSWLFEYRWNISSTKMSIAASMWDSWALDIDYFKASTPWSSKVIPAKDKIVPEMWAFNSSFEMRASGVLSKKKNKSCSFSYLEPLAMTETKLMNFL